MLLAKYVPTLRNKFVASDKREFDLPAAMDWISERRLWKQLFLGKHLSSKQCKALWKWLGRTDNPPKALTILVCREDVDNLLREKHGYGERQ